MCILSQDFGISFILLPGKILNIVTLLFYLKFCMLLIHHCLNIHCVITRSYAVPLFLQQSSEPVEAEAVTEACETASTYEVDELCVLIIIITDNKGLRQELISPEQIMRS